MEPHILLEAERMTNEENAVRTLRNKVKYEIVDRVTSRTYEESLESLKEIGDPTTPLYVLPSRTSDSCKFSPATLSYVQLLNTLKPHNGFRVLNERDSELFRTLMKLIKEHLEDLIDGDVVMPLFFRNLYYTVYNQHPSDKGYVVYPEKVSDYIDSLCCRLRCTRDSLGVAAFDSKSAFFGNITVFRRNDVGESCKEDCSHICQPYRINMYNIVEVEAANEAPEFILVVEKMSIFNVLCARRFHRLKPCVVITGGGEPTVECRSFLRMVQQRLQKPVFVLVDCNAYGMEIYRTYKYGSYAMAFMSRNLVVPQCSIIGLFYSDLLGHKINEDSMVPFNKSDKKKGDELLSENWMQLEPSISESLDSMGKVEKKADIELVVLKEGVESWIEFLLKRIGSRLTDIEKRDKRAKRLKRKRRRANVNLKREMLRRWITKMRVQRRAWEMHK